MRALAPCAALLLLASCGQEQGAAEAPAEALAPESGTPAEGVERAPPVQDAHVEETNRRVDLATEPPEAVAAGEGQPSADPGLPPHPIWWFDGDHWHDRVLKVCMEAIGDDVDEAKELVGEALMDRIRAEFGDAPVDLGVTQDIAILPDGRVRLAAMFEIQPRADAPDTGGPDGDE